MLSAEKEGVSTTLPSSSLAGASARLVQALVGLAASKDGRARLVQALVGLVGVIVANIVQLWRLQDATPPSVLLQMIGVVFCACAAAAVLLRAIIESNLLSPVLSS